MVANPEAVALAEKAASSVGLSVSQLADLLVDNGLAAIPSVDGVTEKYTLEDLGKRLWSTMQEHPKSRRADWFSRLSNVQKTAIVVVLRDRGFASEAIARDFAIPTADVVRTWNAYAADLGAQVVGLRLDTIAGQLQLVAERCQQMASEKSDHNAVWRIQKELVGILQSIGIVEKAIHRVEVTHKMDDVQKAEIEALIALEAKKNKRADEIKRLEVTNEHGDPLPAEVRTDYDAPL